MCAICEGNYSILCPECNPYPETSEIECDCDNGWVRFDDWGNPLTKAEYDAMPEDERMEERCVKCR